MTSEITSKVTRVTAVIGVRSIVTVNIPARRGPPGSDGKDGEPGSLENLNNVTFNGGFF